MTRNALEAFKDSDGAQERFLSDGTVLLPAVREDAFPTHGPRAGAEREWEFCNLDLFEPRAHLSFKETSYRYVPRAHVMPKPEGTKAAPARVSLL
jgi:hypothetical protein